MPQLTPLMQELITGTMDQGNEFALVTSLFLINIGFSELCTEDGSPGTLFRCSSALSKFVGCMF